MCRFGPLLRVLDLLRRYILAGPGQTWMPSRRSWTSCAFILCGFGRFAEDLGPDAPMYLEIWGGTPVTTHANLLSGLEPPRRGLVAVESVFVLSWGQIISRCHCCASPVQVQRNCGVGCVGGPTGGAFRARGSVAVGVTLGEAPLPGVALAFRL